MTRRSRSDTIMIPVAYKQRCTAIAPFWQPAGMLGAHPAAMARFWFEHRFFCGTGSRQSRAVAEATEPLRQRVKALQGRQREAVRALTAAQAALQQAVSRRDTLEIKVRLPLDCIHPLEAAA